VKIQFLYQNNATPTNKAANVLHARWRDSLNHTLSDLTTFMNQMNAGWDNDVLTQMSNVWFHVATVVQSLGGDGLEVSLTQNVAGGTGTESLPPQCAACITWKSGIIQRGGRARTYLPGTPTAALVSPHGSQLTGTFTSSLHTQAQAFLTLVSGITIGSVGIDMGVPSYYSKCQLRGVPVWYPFFAPAVHERIDSQRRRSGKESLFPIG
jgi:hypothetical protein